MGISTVEWFRFKRRTSHIPNLMRKLLKFVFTGKQFRPLYIVEMNCFRPLKFDGWSCEVLSSVHEKIDF